MTLKKHISITGLITAIILLSSCNTKKHASETVFTASISPIKYLVEYITCGDFRVEVLVPDGASPESYSPSASQIVHVEDSRLIFTSGLLDFEQELIARLPINKEAIVDLSRHIDIKKGSCSHSHDATGHGHGVDPHIWTSPEQLKIMAADTYEAVHRLFPDSTRYSQAYETLKEKLDAASQEIREKVAASPTRSFIIYHPALTYYADDYGLTQIPLENEGKEPSAVQMESIIRKAHEQGIKVVLYQKQFPLTVVSTAATDIGAVPIEIDPLKEDIISEILRITDIITAHETGVAP